MGDFLGRLHVLVEGQTEETVVRNVFEEHLTAAGWAVSMSLITTRRPASGPAFHGGLSKWSKLRREIGLLCGDTSIAVLTTLIDYYGLPSDCPGMTDRPSGTPYERVSHVEGALSDAIGDPRFRPHLVMHEFEAWVFAAGDQLADLRADDRLRQRLQHDVATAGGPELINESPATAPSKRLQSYCPDYSKVVDGPLAVADLGIAELRARCRHLDSWLLSLHA